MAAFRASSRSESDQSADQENGEGIAVAVDMHRHKLTGGHNTYGVDHDDLADIFLRITALGQKQRQGKRDHAGKYRLGGDPDGRHGVEEINVAHRLAEALHEIAG